jgi:lipopolysaccharide biosynthesis regulator YciM
MLGDLQAGQGRHDAALASWRLIEAQSPTHMVLVVDRMLENFKKLDRLEEGLDWLKGLLTRHPSLDMFNTLYHAVMEAQGAEAAYQLARDELRRNPSLHALERLAEAELITAPENRREVIQNAKSLIQRHVQRLTRYHCASCGFKASQFFWRCPACGRWDSFDPARHEE